MKPRAMSSTKIMSSIRPIRSIRRFLLLGITSLILVGWTVSAVFNYLHSQEQVEELFDAELAQMSRVLQALVAQEISAHDAPLSYADQNLLAQSFDVSESSPLGHAYERKLALQVWNENGQLLLANNLPLPAEASSLQAGYQELRSADHVWYSFALHDAERKLWFRVAQRDDVRTELTGEIALAAILPGLILTPLLLVLSALIIRRGLAPLHQISTELKNRDYQNLGEIDNQRYPLELQQPVEELNQLFRRVTDSHERERRFTADAAHELRTPLAIAKVHLQNVEQLSQEPKVRAYVHSALTGINRLIHLVQQLLTLNRIDAGIDAPREVEINVVTAVQEELESVQLLPEFSGHRFQLDLPERCVIKSDETGLHMLLRNLLDNACRYSTAPEDNKVKAIEVCLHDNTLSIRNQCPYLSEEELVQVFDRFKRGTASTAQGSGLGLSICQQLAQRAGFTLILRNRQDGVEGVEVLLELPGERPKAL